ncbi:MAG: hypothetical protein M1826_005260 [Phylliscum demangeonii]|nr:MAG: hypothetical protein M1826_005260 [Phylliscum demangeonii]
MEFLSGLPPIDFEPTPATSEDLVVLASDDGTDDDPTQPSAKRRRIEEMARDYSLGIPLFIASASLRGPFSDHRTSVWAPTGSSSRKRLPTKQRTNLAPVNKESVRDAIVENRAQKLESADKATRNEGRVTAQHLPEALTKAAPKAELVEQSVLAMLDGNQSHNGLSRRVRRTTEDEAERIVDDLNPTQIRLTSLAKQHVDRETKSKTDQGASRPELWLKAVKGSTYSRRFAQENGTIVSPQIMAEPIPNRTPVAEDDDIRSACSRRTPTGPAPTVEELDLTSFNPIEEFEELENPPQTKTMLRTVL